MRATMLLCYTNILGEYVHNVWHGLHFVKNRRSQTTMIKKLGHGVRVRGAYAREPAIKAIRRSSHNPLVIKEKYSTVTK